MIRYITTFLVLAGVLSASGQTAPSNRTSSVSVNDAGTVVAPSNLWGALSDAQANALVGRIEQIRNHPVFILPMGEPYKDFVIKGTLTNFQGADSLDHMVYWFASASNLSISSHSLFDSYATVFVCVGQSGRQWRQVKTWRPLFDQFGPDYTLNTVIFIPSKIPGSSYWMYAGNRQLTWSYVRVSPVDFERDANGDVVWNPILPIAWRQAPPDPPNALWPPE